MPVFWWGYPPALEEFYRDGRARSIGIFDFGLSGQDLEAITSLNRGQRTGPDPGKVRHGVTALLAGSGG